MKHEITERPFGAAFVSRDRRGAEAALPHGTGPRPEASTSSVRPLSVGDLVDGRYLVEGVVGRGGMGVVYRARHVTLGKSMALKVVRHDLHDEETSARFRLEAQAASAIGHPNIAQVSDFGVCPIEGMYLVMELLDGESLRSRLARTGPASADFALHVGIQVARALAAAHRTGVVHRDVKPENVMLVQFGEEVDFAKVLDFGIAKVIGATRKLTMDGRVLGTPRYMAPEQLHGGPIDPRADVFSLGALLCEIATGRPSPEVETRLARMVESARMHPARVGDVVRLGPLAPIVVRALAPAPEDRYATMDAMLDALVAAKTSLVAGPRGSERAPMSQERRSPTRALAAVAMLAALAPFGAWVLGARSVHEGGAHLVSSPSAVIPPVAALAFTPVEPESSPAAFGTPSANVTIEADAADAEAWEGARSLGRTPLSLPRPPRGTRRSLRLRAPHREDAPFVLDAEAPSTVHVHLHHRRGQHTESVDARESSRDRDENVGIINPWD